MQTVRRIPLRKSALRAVRELALEFTEEHFVDFICGDRLKTKFQVLQHINEFLTINEFDRWNSVSCCLPACLGSKCSGSDDDAFICTTSHCTPEITDMRR